MHPCALVRVYSLIQKKCQAGNKYALPITVRFDQSTRKLGRISFARFLKLTKLIALLLFYLLSTYLLYVYERFKKGQNEYAYYLNDNEILHALEHSLRYDEFRRRWDSGTQ